MPNFMDFEDSVAFFHSFFEFRRAPCTRYGSFSPIVLALVGFIMEIEIDLFFYARLAQWERQLVLGAVW